MTQTPLNIDRVVREVLAELKRATAGLPSSANGLPGPSAARTNDELVLSTRLVTMAEIGDKLGGIRRMVVDPRAVVTPAVRDALRQRNIVLSRDMPTTSAAPISPRLVVVAARTKQDPKLLASALNSEGIDVDFHSTDCILDATDRMAGELSKGGTLGLLLTPHTAAALCLANRFAGVRAVLGSNTGNVEADASAVGANLLVVNPISVSLFKLCRMAGEFFRGGIRPCPEVFRKRLM